MLHEREHVLETRESNDKVELLLLKSKRLKVDDVLLGTGYRVAIKPLSMIDVVLLTQRSRYCYDHLMGTWLADLHNQHHSNLFMITIVTMESPGTRIV